MSVNYYSEDITNKEMLELQQQLSDEMTKSAKISNPLINKINEIMDNCEHDYKLTGRMAYERYFTCTKCGNEITK
jgi:RNA polymerase-binding transcription factor DksA